MINFWNLGLYTQKIYIPNWYIFTIFLIWLLFMQKSYETSYFLPSLHDWGWKYQLLIFLGSFALSGSHFILFRPMRCKSLLEDFWTMFIPLKKEEYVKKVPIFSPIFFHPYLDTVKWECDAWNCQATAVASFQDVPHYVLVFMPSFLQHRCRIHLCDQ